MKTVFQSILFLFFGVACLAQTIPVDSLFLGQSPPNNNPKIFQLSVTPGFFAAERIAISNDGKCIYYTEQNGYEANSITRSKYYRYDHNKWNGPFILFEGYGCISFSMTGDSLFSQKGTNAYYSLKSGTSWTAPKRMLTKINSAHYLQVTDKGNYYSCSRTKASTGNGEWCKLMINAADTIPVSLGYPLNSNLHERWDFYDFSVSRDESFMIIAKAIPGAIGRPLLISYHNTDGSWTNPKSLGNLINRAYLWGTYITSDNKYLFYSYTTTGNYSDCFIHWVRIDNLVDSLKKTNFEPYLKNQPIDQVATVGKEFSYTIPDSSFVDDDGNNTLTYSAALSNSNTLPEWLHFDPKTKLFSGTPGEVGNLIIKVIAMDSLKAFAECTFQLSIR
jgi:hypothetical protein